MDGPVPVIRDINDLYPQDDLPKQRDRFSRLLQAFKARYQQNAQFVSRSPGRVNLIGEHIDYSLYEVLPMAITADVLIAVSVAQENIAGAKVICANVNDEKYNTEQFDISAEGNIEIDPSTHQWTNYFKSGFRGAVELLRKSDPNFHARGMHVLVDGSVPAGAGLSSSAAFVCATALAVLRANGKEKVVKEDLVQLAIVSERSVGVNSGGMDQAASVFSIKGDAVSVEFFPDLHAETIKFPELDPPMTFMIAQSFVTADKHVTAPHQYNLRVVECTLAAEVLAAKESIKVSDDAGPLGRSLRGFQSAFEDAKTIPQDPAQLKERVKGVLELVSKHLTNSQDFTREDIASVMDTTVSDIEQRYMTKFPVQAKHFHLGARASHVLQEALRVLDFKALLKDKDNPALLPQLGKLMNQTQESCRNLYECSCPEIDSLCDIAQDHGAYGSRLTGAGWGGCTVHLVPKDKVESIKSAWEEQYYRVRDPSMTRARMDETGAVVVSEPGHGSMIPRAEQSGITTDAASILQEQKTENGDATHRPRNVQQQNVEQSATTRQLSTVQEQNSAQGVTTRQNSTAHGKNARQSLDGANQHVVQENNAAEGRNQSSDQDKVLPAPRTPQPESSTSATNRKTVGEHPTSIESPQTPLKVPSEARRGPSRTHEHRETEDLDRVEPHPAPAQRADGMANTGLAQMQPQLETFPPYSGPRTPSPKDLGLEAVNDPVDEPVEPEGVLGLAGLWNTASHESEHLPVQGAELRSTPGETASSITRPNKRKDAIYPPSHASADINSSTSETQTNDQGTPVYATPGDELAPNFIPPEVGPPSTRTAEEAAHPAVQRVDRHREASVTSTGTVRQDSNVAPLGPFATDITPRPLGIPDNTDRGQNLTQLSSIQVEGNQMSCEAQNAEAPDARHPQAAGDRDSRPTLPALANGQSRDDVAHWNNQLYTASQNDSQNATDAVNNENANPNTPLPDQGRDPTAGPVAASRARAAKQVAKVTLHNLRNITRRDRGPPAGPST
ncbi:uncharacterized protein KY384_000691 [Bacidia gigantensis]|uniref:uncharacterized protein n=1 Tax=Bacidia gigantensis TaxID=2732470 RepID=UPI001D0528B6|nr:uncharacterized protein KY384_000691 [Bacidia gigantensis]KAG8525929.1 hypothetical protein KY384_000691 [Bacidia gigantensis]